VRVVTDVTARKKALCRSVADVTACTGLTSALGNRCNGVHKGTLQVRYICYGVYKCL